MLIYGKVIDQKVVSAKNEDLDTAMDTLSKLIDAFINRERKTGEAPLIIAPTDNIQVNINRDATCFFVSQQWLVVEMVSC